MKLSKVLSVNSLLTFVSWFIVPFGLYAVDYSTVPGTVIDYHELSYPWYYFFNEKGTPADQFVADPDIIKLPNGYYLAGHSWGGDDGPVETRIFRSTNQGTSWTLVSTQSNFTSGSLFVSGGYVYYVGENSSGDAVVLKSTDNGSSWTRSSAFTGLTSGTSTPANPVDFAGRWWTSGGITANLSALTNANLLLESSWAVGGGGLVGDQNSWLSEGATIGESQIVASPDLGVFILPKVKEHRYTALVRVNPATRQGCFDPINSFAALPGGEKKFGAAYDSTSGKFFITGNPIVPADGDASSDIATDMIRNTAALLSSKDLLNWDVEKIYIYSSDERREGYGYLNFDFDGDDLLAVARTAEKISGEQYPHDGRAHDSNCFTFHRFEDFRTAVADHVVSLYNGNVILYERTPETVDESVIFGNFALGAFSGMTADAQGVGLDNGGQDIYIKRSAASGGDVFHFDAFGNFLENVGTTAPVSVTNTAVVSRRVAGECSWSLMGSGSWAETENWFYWNRADTTDEIAVFGTAINADATVTIPSVQQWWQFNTTGDFEGWSVVRSADATVSGGTLHGTGDSAGSTTYLVRSDRFFYGSDAPSIAFSMQAEQNCDVYLFWSTTDDPNNMTYVLGQYTGNGAFQTVQFNMEGVSGWEGKAIAALRIDPRVQAGSTRSFAFDWISMPKAAVRLKGMRFDHHDTNTSYTIGGGGMIALDADSGNASLEVVQGLHTISAPIMLKTNTDATLADGAALDLTGNLNLYGRTLNVSGEGQLSISGIVYLSSGTLCTDGENPICINSGISGSLNGTLEFDPGAGFSPSEGQDYDLLDNPGALNGMTFSSLSLPSLPSGLRWNTGALYTSGTVSIEQISQTLPYTETFESISVGQSIIVTGNSNGWYCATNSSSAVVTNETYTWEDVLHPVEGAAHTKVLTCDGTDLQLLFAENTTPVNTTMDFMISPVSGTPAAGSVDGKQSAFYVDSSGYLNVWCGLDGTGTNNTWITYTNTPIGSSDWIRMTFEFDYTTDSGGLNYFRVTLNGDELSPGSNCYTRGASSFSANSAGTWLLTANQSVNQVAEFALIGSGMIDDVVATTNTITDFFPAQGDSLKLLPSPADDADSDGDGVPDWKEFIAGTDPSDPDSIFRINSIVPDIDSGTDGFVIRWSSETDHVYDLYWSTNLSEGFSPLATNLFATPPENAYTNPYAGPVFFYKVESKTE